MDTIRLFFLTNPSDSSITDFLDFNLDSRGKKTNIENAFIRKITKTKSDGVGENQSVEQDLGDKQALGEIETKVILEGFISQRNASSGANTFLDQLERYANASKQNTNWPEGQFGVIDVGNQNNSVIPVRTGSSQIGLIWESYESVSDLGKNQEDFKIVLTVSKGDGT